MKMLKKTPLLLGVFFTIALIGFICLVYAVPMVPTVFSGTVTYTKDTSMNLYGYDINFTIGSYGPVKVGTVGSGNSFEVDVDPNGNTGDIYFFIGGSEANEVGSYIKGGFVELDLTINDTPSQVIDPELYCGDGICNNGETCSTCPGDCGQCDDGDDGDDDDGSSGSSRSSSSSSNDVIILGGSGSGSSDSGSSSGSGMTGDVIGDTNPQKGYGFADFLTAGGLIVILAGMIIVLGIILLLLPKR